MIELTPQQWTILQHSGDEPVHVVDPSQQSHYVLLKAETYQRLKPDYDDGPLSDAERQFLLQEFGRRAGWDDPAMDVYNDLDPRRKT